MRALDRQVNRRRKKPAGVLSDAFCVRV